MNAKQVKNDCSLLPTYIKIYAPFQYDRVKYGKIYKRLRNTAVKLNDPGIFKKVSPYLIYSRCIKKDKSGNRVYLSKGDKHIFRYSCFQSILEKSASKIIEKYQLKLTPDVIKYIFKRTGVLLYLDNENLPSAEIVKTNQLAIKDRIKVHILFIRLLDLDFEIEECIEYINLEFNKLFSAL